MSKKEDHQIDGYFDYVVPPLEGFWWQDGVKGIDYARKENFNWISAIRLPDFVTKADFEWAIREARKKKKTDFERCVMETFPAFFECAQEAEAGMAALKEKEHEDRLCHGNMDHHHILMGEGYTAVIEFHKMHLGDQMEDLYHFVRKTMEKHNWDIRLGQEMFAAYDRIMPLSMEKICLLYTSPSPRD
mgnify:FL=1